MKLTGSLFRFPVMAASTLAVVTSLAGLGLAAEGAATPATAQAEPPASATTTVVTAAPAGATPMPAQTIPRRKPGRFSQFIARLQLGVKPSYSQLLSARTRNSFGDGGLSIRPSFFRLRVPVSPNELGWDYGFNRAKFNENRMTMVTLGAAYQHNFRVAAPLSPDATDEEKAAWQAGLGSYPYVGLGINVVATKLRVPAENLDTNFKLGLGATVTAGYQIKQRVRVQGSVTGMTPVSGYSFSSMRVALDYKM